MAKLDDLPAELIRRIIDQVIYDQEYDPHGTGVADYHHALDYNEIVQTPQKPWPHLDHRDYNGGSSLPFYYPKSYHLIDPRKNHREPEKKKRGKKHGKKPAGKKPIPPPPVSWPHGLPSNPLLPLSLVNHTFQRFAQESLFNNVALLDGSQVYSFSRAITGPSQQHNSELRRLPTGTKSRPLPRRVASSRVIDPSCPSSLARLVRSIQFKWLGSGTMCRIAVNSICDIIQSCSSLENIAMSNRLYVNFKEPILKALENKRLTKEFVLMDNAREHKNNTSSSMQHWHVEGGVGHLLSSWDSLETVELTDLSIAEVTRFGRVQKPIPSPICALKTIILSWFDIYGSSLSLLLKSSRESM
ncbi:hypothetical protein PGT21_016479 [Puccinia graminis f. sp. tritici]|uniref:Uncharacterized protein n=1 Tax=Puccinia graminis f. sp. tritici TaxID=56615 RepID=A0A5B0R1H0_PUCGR|nr:hypothetical protein PGT21_016479 [Puccinia graminis f. sp. tritici]